ncbi:MAG TPA: hypothetical protein VN922_09815 [Bacteroidia bacterium]|nr:hypothetical protein [Bacteroidia bacterium]
MENQDSNPRSAIDQALGTCHDIINVHRKENRTLLTIALTVGAGCASYFMYSLLRMRLNPSSGNIETQGYIVYIFGIVVISILTALYRFHLKEISRAQQNLIAFMRIRIAASSYKDGFATEVRKSLTENAFHSDITQTNSAKNKPIESPVPGHPASELSTLVVNKLLEILIQKEKKEQSSEKTDT